MSHIQQMRDLFARNRRKIQARLGWDDERYCHFQYDMGLRYMDEVLMLSPFDRRQMEGCQLFWRWWLNEWNITDHDYAMRVVLPSATPEKNYVYIHSPQYLSVFPASTVMQDRYASMIGQLNDTLKQDLTNERQL